MNISVTDLLHGDRDQLIRIIKKQRNFSDADVAIAIEVLDAALTSADSYQGLVALDEDKRQYGFVLYGNVPLTVNRYDLYWIAVDPAFKRDGIGTVLLNEMEYRLMQNGPGHIYIDTSSTEPYLHARRFYEKNDYQPVARLKDFFRPGDDKIIYCKIF